MIKISNTENSLMITYVEQDVDYILPKGVALAIQSDDTDTVDLKMIGTRKTVLSLKASEVQGYSTARQLAEALQSML